MLRNLYDDDDDPIADRNIEKVKNITSDKLSILVEDVRKDVVGLELAFKRHEYGMNKTADQIESSTLSMTVSCVIRSF